MNPRAWAAWSGAALVVVLTSTNPVYRALVLLVALNVLVSLRRPDATLRPLLIAVTAAGIVAAVLNTLLSHTGAHIVFSLPDQVPGIGGPITGEAALFGVDVALGVAAAVLAVAPLSRVMHPHDLIDALPRRMQRTAALTGAALNMVPALARSAVAINEAQRMRGSARGRRRDWQASAAPIVLSALDDSLQLAEAMEARGFGSGPRTQYVTAHLDRASIVGTVAAAAAIVLTVVARSVGQLPDWYPFPSASLPEVSVLPVIACLLLAFPLVAWRRS